MKSKPIHYLIATSKPRSWGYWLAPCGVQDTGDSQLNWTEHIDEVTCKNCLRSLRKDDKSNAESLHC